MSTIITKNSSTAAAVPLAGDLVKGELAVNVTDKKLYTKDNSGAVFLLASATSATDAAASAALANDWATKTAGPVAGGEYSAKYHAQAASTSASSASASASTASAAQTAAESARDATLAAYDSFDDRYLGTKSSNPTVDNDGNPLVAGALYFNSVAQEMRLYTGSAWVAAYVSGAGYATLTGAETLTNKTITYSNNTLTGVQPTLVSGTNIKTVGGSSLLGSGDLSVVGSSLVFISSITASNSATIDIENAFTDYDDYLIIANDIECSAASINLSLNLQLKIDNAYQTGANYAAKYIRSDNTFTATTTSTAGTVHAIAGGGSGSLPNTGFIARLHGFGTSSTTLRRGISHSGVSSSAGIILSSVMWGGTATSQKVTGIRYQFGSGNILTGTFRLYGIKKS